MVPPPAMASSAPPFPVINAKPTGLAVLGNFYLSDYFRLIMGTAIGGAWGFMAGAQSQLPSSGHTFALKAIRSLACAGKPVRRQGSLYVAAIGGFCCFLASFQSSYFRLTGNRPNPDECASAGIPFTHN